MGFFGDYLHRDSDSTLCGEIMVLNVMLYPICVGPAVFTVLNELRNNLILLYNSVIWSIILLNTIVSQSKPFHLIRPICRVSKYFHHQKLLMH